MPGEICFGILIKTWGILWRNLEMKFCRRGPLVSALIHLHNMRRTAGLGVIIPGSQQIRFINGVEEWGIPQKTRDGAVTVVWYVAIELDEHNRPTQLLGERARFNKTARAPAPAPPPPPSALDPTGPSAHGMPTGYTVMTLQARNKMLQDAIDFSGVARPR